MQKLTAQEYIGIATTARCLLCLSTAWLSVDTKLLKCESNTGTCDAHECGLFTALGHLWRSPLRFGYIMCFRVHYLGTLSGLAARNPLHHPEIDFSLQPPRLQVSVSVFCETRPGLCLSQSSNYPKILEKELKKKTFHKIFLQLPHSQFPVPSQTPNCSIRPSRSPSPSEFFSPYNCAGVALLRFLSAFHCSIGTIQPRHKSKCNEF